MYKVYNFCDTVIEQADIALRAFLRGMILVGKAILIPHIFVAVLIITIIEKSFNRVSGVIGMKSHKLLEENKNDKPVHIRVVIQDRQKFFGRNVMVGVLDHVNGVAAENAKQGRHASVPFAEILDVTMEIAWHYGFHVLMLVQGVDDFGEVFEDIVNDDDDWGLHWERNAVAYDQELKSIGSITYVDNMKEYLDAFDDLRFEHGASYGEVVYRR